jgi:post-segregation antitoxin (ccd killing protein)
MTSNKLLGEREVDLLGLVQVELERGWLRENWDAIADYNRRVAEQGLLSDEADPAGTIVKR